LILNKLCWLQVECVERLTTLLGCPASHAKSILIVNRWDVDRVVSMLADKGIEEVYKVSDTPAH
jgi:hypothetical protein